MDDLKRKKRPLVCRAEGCGHDLVVHDVTVDGQPCRVTGCTCPQWRVEPETPKPTAKMPASWQEDVENALASRQIAVLFSQTWTTEQVALELMKAALGVGHGSVRPIVFLLEEQGKSDA